MRRIPPLARPVVAASIAASLLGCYHATIETGAPAANQIYEERWATGWLIGLVPPKTIAASQKCPGGVAKVETKLSFLNQVAAAVTLGIYTPMHIVVTCAAGAKTHTQDPDLTAPPEDLAGAGRALREAAIRSLDEGRPILVQFR